MTVLYFLGAIIGYFGNRDFTFTYEGSFLGSGSRYIIAHLIGYFINLIILIIFVDFYMYPHQWVQAVAIFLVAGFLLIAFKYFVFKQKINRPTASTK
jgi:putative flippase GtrA